MIVSTTHEITGYRVTRHLGVVQRRLLTWGLDPRAFLAKGHAIDGPGGPRGPGFQGPPPV